MRPLFHFAGGLAILLAGLWIGWAHWNPGPDPGFALPTYQPGPPEAPRLASAIINSGEPPRVHAASITALADGRLCAAWFAGLREGGTEVEVHWSCKGADAKAWGPQQPLVTATQASADTGLWVRKLGNPLLFQTPNGELWLIFVSVTLGGWSTSHLNLMRSLDMGKSWQRAKRLWLTPFLNLSTLVKGPPVFFDNGDIGVPVYQELAGVFPELLIFSPKGALKTKVRMANGRHSLQPVVLPKNRSEATALLRDGTHSNRSAWRSHTRNTGRSWQESWPTTLANPGSALTAVRLDDGSILAVANDVEKGRRRLSLLTSRDEGQHWRVLYRFEDKENQQQIDIPALQRQLGQDIPGLGAGPDAVRVLTNSKRNLCRSQGRCDWQYDYPYLIRDRQGDFHLVYSWNRSFIRHIHFNQAWLDSLL